MNSDSPTPDPGPRIAPGTVWWCDGVALSFEAHFKRRPVLVLGVRVGESGESAEVVVAPLSSRLRYGQEQAVTHAGGVSYLTGQVATVPAAALYKSLGAWDGFADWSAAQQAPPPKPGLLAQLRARFARRIH